MNNPNTGSTFWGRIETHFNNAWSRLSDFFSSKEADNYIAPISLSVVESILAHQRASNHVLPIINHSDGKITIDLDRDGTIDLIITHDGTLIETDSNTMHNLNIPQNPLDQIHSSPGNLHEVQSLLDSLHHHDGLIDSLHHHDGLGNHHPLHPPSDDTFHHPI